MVKAHREYAEALAARQTLSQDDVTAFVGSVASAARAAPDGSAAQAAAGLEAVVPLALFLSRSLGKVRMGGFPQAQVPWSFRQRTPGIGTSLVAPPAGQRELQRQPTSLPPSPTYTPNPSLPPMGSSPMLWCRASWKRCSLWWPA